MHTTVYDVEREIKAIVADVSGCEIEEITPETNIVKDLDIDSIKAIEITVALEKKFKISIREEDVPKIIYIKEAIKLAETLLLQKEAHAK